MVDSATLRLLREAVYDNPIDLVARGIYADALDDDGKDADAEFWRWSVRHNLVPKRGILRSGSWFWGFGYRVELKDLFAAMKKIHQYGSSEKIPHCLDRLRDAYDKLKEEALCG